MRAREVDEALEVVDALVLEPLQLVGEVADAVGQAVGQARLAEAAVATARPERHGLRLEDDDAQGRVRVGQGDRRPQAGEAAADDGDIDVEPLPGVQRRIDHAGRRGLAQPVADGGATGRHRRHEGMVPWPAGCRADRTLRGPVSSNRHAIRRQGDERGSILALTALRRRMARWRRTASRIAQRPSHGPRRDPGQTRRTRSSMATEPAARTTPSLQRETQPALYQRALKTLPGGTDSNFRAWGESTIYVDRGKGGMVWDVDGNEFVDLRMGYGPVILGHGDDRVDDYVNERMRRGRQLRLTREDEVRAMELVKELTGWVDKARMTVSGTEATMHAMRVARAYTGREKIVKFEGQYHGVHDYALISVGPDDMSELGDEDAPVALAWGRGIPGAVAETIIPARYNQIDALRTLFEQRGEEIAAIIVEPVLGNAQGIMPKPGLPQGDAGPDRGVRHPADLR